MAIAEQFIGPFLHLSSAARARVRGAPSSQVTSFATAALLLATMTVCATFHRCDAVVDGLVGQSLPSEFVAQGIRFVRISRRSFRMGRDPAELYGQNSADVAAYETPRHRVKLEAEFFVSETVISRRQYEQSGLAGDAEDVSWEEAAAFAEWMNSGEGEGADEGGQAWSFRLPTEAEWQCVHDFHRGREVKDIGGGSREWTGDWLGPFRPGKRINPLGPRYGQMKVNNF